MKALECLSFEVQGRLAHFRKPWANSSALSYGAPPPPTILGIIGAAAGWPRDEVDKRSKGLELAVEPLTLLRRQSFTVNVLHDDRGKLVKGARTQVPFEFLRGETPGAPVAYRVHLVDQGSDRLDELRPRLEAPVWPISLGPAFCLANLRNVKRVHDVEIAAADGPVHGVVDTAEIEARRGLPAGSVEPIVLRMDAARNPRKTAHVLIPERPDPTHLVLKRGLRVESRTYGLL